MTLYKASYSFFVFMLVAFSIPVFSAPDLQNTFQVNGAKLFQDHRQKNLFYYLPGTLELVYSKGKPLFRYNLYRYMGRKELGDSDAFRVRGILTFEVKEEGNAALHQQLVSTLKKRFGQNAILKPAPISNFESKLVYRTVEADGQEQTEEGLIEGGVSRETIDEDPARYRAGWTQRRFTIGLKPLTAELFWKAFEQDKLLLSLAYMWEMPGVTLDETADEPWQKRSYELSNTLPLSISMQKWPDHFGRSDIGQTMKMGHTTLTVLCYDFINEIKSNLYSVTVEVMFRTQRNQDYVERVKYTEGDDNYEKDISFKLAKNPGAGYQYRVRRLFKDGSKEWTDWQHYTGQQLDVSNYDS